MTLDCVIIDDEPLARTLLEGYVEKTTFLNLRGSFNSALNAIRSLAEHPVQLIFLDIQMPDLNGMEFARMLPPETKVVFTTAFPEYAVEGFRVNALDYLMKPIEYKDFLESANKALTWHQQHSANSVHTAPQNADDDFIFVKTDYRTVQVRFDEILYIEGVKDYLRIVLEGSQKPILTLMSMKSMEEYLPSPRFMRVHRSYIVQMNKIKEIDRGQIVFDRQRITISEGYKNNVQQYLQEHQI